MSLADLTLYSLVQRRLRDLHVDPYAWDRKAIIHVACSGKVSSDQKIGENATKFGGDNAPCP
jgi:glucan phosphorylase